MDNAAFRKVFRDIKLLDASEGPSRNIFQPKFDAREQAITLEKTLLNCQKEDPSLRALSQLAHVVTFIAVNMHETEEEKEALATICRSYDIVSAVCCGLTTPELNAKDTATTIVSILRTESPPCDEANAFQGAVVYTEVLNALGILLSSRREPQSVEDALKVLALSESVYHKWVASWKACGKRNFKDLPLNQDGSALLDTATEEDWACFEMEQIFTSTLYYLAQVFGFKSDVRNSSKYCHLTLARQLISRKEFDRKSWATNALHLSGFYSGELQYHLAYHCLEAGRAMMPTEPANEETLGLVAWSFGKFHKSRLRTAAQQLDDGQTSLAPPTTVGPNPEPLEYSEWWCNFELLVAPPQPLPPIVDFASAREEFKKANAFLQEATKYYVFDGCCTEYIAIHQDMAELYVHLMRFESDVERKIAMHQRRFDLLRSFPDQLSFQAYGTLVRQLLFDVGDIAGEILDLRIKQFKEKIGTPLSERKINDLADVAQGIFLKFLATFHDKNSGKMPTTIEEVLRAPVFRAMMRAASLEAKHFSRTPREEYDRIGRTIEKYNECISFAEQHQLQNDPAMHHEVCLAREMVQLLPAKQREAWKAGQMH